MTVSHPLRLETAVFGPCAQVRPLHSVSELIQEARRVANTTGATVKRPDALMAGLRSSRATAACASARTESADCGMLLDCGDGHEDR